MASRAGGEVSGSGDPGERERATLSVRPRAPYLRRWAFFSSLLDGVRIDDLQILEGRIGDRRAVRVRDFHDEGPPSEEAEGARGPERCQRPSSPGRIRRRRLVWAAPGRDKQTLQETPSWAVKLAGPDRPRHSRRGRGTLTRSPAVDPGQWSASRRMDRGARHRRRLRGGRRRRARRRAAGRRRSGRPSPRGATEPRGRSARGRPARRPR